MSVGSSSSSSPERVSVAAVIVAGGAGLRMGRGSTRKQYLDLLGTPVLLWSVRTFVGHPAVGHTVVVLPAADAEEPPHWLADLPVAIVAGGPERRDSVRNGLDAVPFAYGTVLVHDAARPLVPPDLIDRVIAGVGDGGAVAALRVADTVKQANGEMVERTVDRAGLWLAQTPQGFRIDALRAAHARALAEGWAVTDDAGVCERYGIPIRLVEGAPENLKITRAADLRLAEALARGLRESPAIRGHQAPHA